MAFNADVTTASAKFTLERTATGGCYMAGRVYRAAYVPITGTKWQFSLINQVTDGTKQSVAYWSYGTNSVWHAMPSAVAYPCDYVGRWLNLCGYSPASVTGTATSFIDGMAIKGTTALSTGVSGTATNLFGMHIHSETGQGTTLLDYAYLQEDPTFFQFPFHHVDWDSYEGKAEAIQNVTWAGTVETLHAHNARFITWRGVGLTEEDRANLHTFWDSIGALGTTFRYFPDSNNLATVHLVKWDGKDFKTRQDPPRSGRYTIDMRLRRVG
jgi:hypothetical protein